MKSHSHIFAYVQNYVSLGYYHVTGIYLQSLKTLVKLSSYSPTLSPLSYYNLPFFSPLALILMFSENHVILLTLL